MNKISQTFVKALKKGFDAANMITEQDKKALAYAELAKAIAATGLVEDVDVSDTEAIDKEEAPKKTDNKKAANTKKDALKPESGKGAAKPKEEVEEQVPTEEIAPVQEETPVDTQTEVEIEEEWTDAMVELKSDILARLNAYAAEDAWGEEYVYNDCVSAFFESAETTGKENIRPTNIDGFVTYLDQLAEQFAAQQ